jgi:acetylornithine/succinyldiaminopimelate/putrescine aminotransferase
MLSNRQLFLLHNGQTSTSPLMLEVERAEGNYIYDTEGKKYLDFISGISVSGIGHRHPAVVKAVKDQVDLYMHTMVYGEYIQSPQVKLANSLHQLLNKAATDSEEAGIWASYFTCSGAEATEGAMKLAKRYTGRNKIFAFKNAYHGSTQGALSLMSEPYFKEAFYPLLPNIHYLDYNAVDQLQAIDEDTACVFVEIIQSETGYINGSGDFLSELRNRCTKKGALLVIDECQTGFGRTGTMFAHEQFHITPDILTLAKGMGGGMPMGAFIAPKYIMDSLSDNPILGHITTFGGHPVCCAAGLATISVLLEENYIQKVLAKETYFRSLLKHKLVKSVSGTGLMLSLEFENFEQNKRIIDRCLKAGLITDWFLFAPEKLRITPPLTINDEEIKEACEIILKSIEDEIK